MYIRTKGSFQAPSAYFPGYSRCLYDPAGILDKSAGALIVILSGIWDSVTAVGESLNMRLPQFHYAYQYHLWRCAIVRIGRSE